MTDLKLAGKLAAIMASVKPLPKEGNNPSQNYKFVTVGQMLDELRPKMAAAGIAILPEVVSIDYVDAGQTAGGAHKTACHMIVRFTFTDGVESVNVVTAGEANDSGDKAANKAFTAAQKQALSKVFMISADEDNDANHEERTVVTRAPSLARGPSKFGRCTKHSVEFFQSEKMRSPAHRMSDGTWCNMPVIPTNAPADDAGYDAWEKEQKNA